MEDRVISHCINLLVEVEIKGEASHWRIRKVQTNLFVDREGAGVLLIDDNLRCINGCFCPNGRILFMPWHLLRFCFGRSPSNLHWHAVREHC
jgi:hypothetical protein